ncbi:hypothetical protein GE061_009099 [Apolygus lucorum]|uniref:DDE Tnp4 domain-containing protein n=1 Tax=Apolygus lucorum TaxID=248454 RepID=A0A8S9XXW2_APOLU|nr:hypothetical protein GE061_010638 [Apolygus lucorum]KAF6214359.1 hypothetical protein GE061_009099 [Apolygus lucorum]
MRPFAVANNADRRHIIYNYRHSRCRRVIENTFGILASRFRIYRRPIIAKVETVDKIVQATIVLHNWLRTRDIDSRNAVYIPTGFADWEDANGTLHEGQWRQEPQTDGLVSLVRNSTTNASNLAKTIREHQALYFLSNGEVEWQWQHLPVLRGP